jgi:hypothetical protein
LLVIDISILDKDLVALVTVGFDGVTISVLVLSSTNELEVLPVFRGETVDVAEFIVVSPLTDDSELAGMNIDVLASFAVVVNNVDTWSEMSTVVDVTPLLENVDD